MTCHSREERIRRELPYGVWSFADGSLILFNRKYQPILRRTADGAVEPMEPQWVRGIIGQHWFYDDANPAAYDAATRKTCKKILDDFSRGRPIDDYWRVHEERRAEYEARRWPRVVGTQPIDASGPGGAS